MLEFLLFLRKAHGQTRLRVKSSVGPSLDLGPPRKIVTLHVGEWEEANILSQEFSVQKPSVSSLDSTHTPSPAQSRSSGCVSHAF